MKQKAPWLRAVLAAAVLAFAAYLYLFFTAGVEPQHRLSVGLILPKEYADSAWYQTTRQGLEKTAEKIGSKLLVEEDVPDSADGMAAIDRLHREGAMIIVSACYGYGDLFRAAGEKYPSTHFYTIIPDQNETNVRTYFVRIYQLRYLQGMLAGMKTKTNRIGFVSVSRVPDNVQELDAFALGVRRVNPAAEVLVSFQNRGDYSDEAAIAIAERMVAERGVDVLASHRQDDAVAAWAVAQGIDAVGSYDELPDDPHLLSRQSIDWAAVWSELIKEDARHSNPRAFYWFGFDRAGFRFDIVSPAVTESERARIAEAEQAIRDGFEPFSGVIYDNEGNLRCHEGETVSDTALREEIDWLAEGVVVYDE